MIELLDFKIAYHDNILLSVCCLLSMNYSFQTRVLNCLLFAFVEFCHIPHFCKTFFETALCDMEFMNF